MTTTLYIKTHNVTGLKYFGKTIRKDPEKYRGSGVHWKRHIKVHGYDVTTEIYGVYEDLEQCRIDALAFSQQNDIVLSKDWANFKDEELDGGWQHVNDDLELSEYRKIRQQEWRDSLTPEERKELSAKIGKRGEDNYFYGKKFIKEEHPRFGTVLTDEHKKILSESVKGKTAYKDAITGEPVGMHEINHPKLLSGEWVNVNTGKTLSEEHKNLLREKSLAAGCTPPSGTGKFWWNNGVINKFCTEQPEGFVPGKVFRKRKPRTPKVIQ